MKIAKIVDGAVSEINDYRVMFPNTSFSKNGPSDQFLTEQGCKKVKVSEVIDRDTKKIVSASAYIDGDFVKTYTVENLTAEEIAANTSAETARKEAAVRKQRDSKLAETDFYALSDVTMSAEMTTYRQALRDITSHANFPYLEKADWPTKP